MNHKRGRPKSRRAGCLFCKPHKHQRAAKTPRSPAALAVLNERPPVATPAWLFGPLERVSGLVVDLEPLYDFDDYYDDDSDDLPDIEARPLRVSLSEAASLLLCAAP